MSMGCITGMNPYGHCGSAQCCPEPYDCCGACPLDCNIRCGWIEDKGPSGTPVPTKQGEESI
jgi:hypothetical protein